MWSAQLHKADPEADLSKAISRLKQVPSQLKVAVDGLLLDPTDDFPLSLWMQVPEMLLLAETKAAAFQLSVAQQHCPSADSLFLEPAIHEACGQHKFLSFASQPGPQKKEPLAFLDAIWMAGMLVETPQVAVEGIRWRQGSSWEMHLVSSGSLEKSGIPETMAMAKQKKGQFLPLHQGMDSSKDPRKGVFSTGLIWHISARSLQNHS